MPMSGCLPRWVESGDLAREQTVAEMARHWQHDSQFVLVGHPGITGVQFQARGGGVSPADVLPSEAQTSRGGSVLPGGRSPRQGNTMSSEGRANRAG